MEYTVLKRYEAELVHLGTWIVEHYPGEIADGIRRGESTITVAHRLLKRGLVRHEMARTLAETYGDPA